MPTDAEFFNYQMKVNRDVGSVASQCNSASHQQARQDYRAESKENPVAELRDRHCDNTKLRAVCVSPQPFRRYSA